MVASVSKELFAEYCGASGSYSGLGLDDFLKVCEKCNFFCDSFTEKDAKHIFKDALAQGETRLGAAEFDEALDVVAKRRLGTLKGLAAGLAYMVRNGDGSAEKRQAAMEFARQRRGSAPAILLGPMEEKELTHLSPLDKMKRRRPLDASLTRNSTRSRGGSRPSSRSGSVTPGAVTPRRRGRNIDILSPIAWVDGRVSTATLLGKDDSDDEGVPKVKPSKSFRNPALPPFDLPRRIGVVSSLKEREPSTLAPGTVLALRVAARSSQSLVGDSPWMTTSAPPQRVALPRRGAERACSSGKEPRGRRSASLAG
eukprot:TRINITY_DN12234_c0_g3_i1.p1 TRINITY_DN12234_c0_g3~~TRINITY_DN12234_c0_g3_i1.p1  ORF type:complete len:336 (-),score=34.70 TRINITY_DN12234_c0_g3_i1:126-1058(-)